MTRLDFSFAVEYQDASRMWTRVWWPDVGELFRTRELAEAALEAHYSIANRKYARVVPVAQRKRNYAT